MIIRSISVTLLPAYAHYKSYAQIFQAIYKRFLHFPASVTVHSFLLPQYLALFHCLLPLYVLLADFTTHKKEAHTALYIRRAPLCI